jgi:phage minor structural protein
LEPKQPLLTDQHGLKHILSQWEVIGLPDLLIFDPHDNLLATLSNEAEKACSFWSAPFKEVVNNGSSFEFTAAGDHEDSKYIVAENQVAFMDKDGYFRLFVIKEPDRTDDQNGPVIRALCEPAVNELNDEIIEDVRPYNTTLQDAQTRTLAGTRWKSGITAELGLKSTNYYYISVAEAIEKNINTWGGEFRDRIEFDGNKITGRYIDILPRRGADTGKIWEMDKDIISVSHKVQSYPKTALYGRGASLETENGGFTRRISFASVEWKKAAGDPVDKPLGQEWVGDPGALQQFGRLNSDGKLRHRKGVYENSEQSDPKLLLQETWEALQQAKRQIENFEMDVFLLEEITGYEHEKVRLGDTTFAIDRSFANPIEIEERVISFEYDVADPDNSGVVELGQYIPLFDDTDERIEKIEAKLNDRSGIWDKVEKPITDSDFPDTVPAQPINVEATGLFKTIVLDWELDMATYIASYEVYASQVSGFTPDSSNLVYRGKTSGFAFKAETDQQWYFRIRAINTHGTPSEFSQEVMAQTIQATRYDIAPLTITNELIAENAAIDFAKLANVKITNAHITNGSIDFGKLTNVTIINAHIQNEAVDNSKIKVATIEDSRIKSLAAEKILAGEILVDSNNLAFNSLWKNDTQGWTVGSTYVTREKPSFAFRGENTIHVNVSGQTAPLWRGASLSDGYRVPVQEGEWITASIYYWTPYTSGFPTADDYHALEILWYDASGTRIGQQSKQLDIFYGNTTPVQPWRRGSVTAQAPSGAVYASMNFWVRQNGRAYYSHPQIQRGRFLTEYTPNGTQIGPNGVMTTDIKFSGELTGATGTFSGTVSGGTFDASDTSLSHRTVISKNFGTFYNTAYGSGTSVYTRIQGETIFQRYWDSVAGIYKTVDLTGGSDGWTVAGAPIVSAAGAILSRAIGGQPYIGWSNDSNTLYDARMLLENDTMVALSGATFKVTRNEEAVSIRPGTGERSFVRWYKNGTSVGYIGTSTVHDDFLLYSYTNKYVLNGGSIDTSGSVMRLHRTDSDYWAQSSTSAVIYFGGVARHTFGSSGTKSGGSIEIDSEVLGMSPIDSPQVLMEYIEFDIPLDEAGVKVYLDSRFRKGIVNFAVFTNNGTIIEKGFDYFVISGSGLADCRIVGERIGHDEVFWADMSLLNESREEIAA